MSVFNTNKNSFLSSVQLLKNDFHAYTSLGIAKGSRNEKQQKRALISNINAAVDSIDTDDFGIRVIILKTKD
jgi:hypothetical protein